MNKWFVGTGALMGILALQFIPVHAQMPTLSKLMDTAGDGQEEVDLSLYWPEKLIIDTSVSKIMLVWFHLEQPRHTDISFSQITNALF